ncbi:MAG: hypothetical protein LBV12_10000, partial [Puniceicoccales bacterium]|nr:hypothetical protein [Puniceicoccales bacterium]
MKNTFDIELNRVRRALWTGRVLVLGLFLISGVMGAWVLFGLADVFFAFEPKARTGITVFLVASFAMAGAWIWYRFCSVSRKTAAEAVDRHSRSERAPVTAALNVSPEKAATTMARWLAGTVESSAVVTLKKIPGKQLFPFRYIRHGAILLTGALILVAVLKGLFPVAFSVVGGRLLHPGADLPPWSRLTFAVEPESPSAIYGGELELGVTITGAPVEQPVECLLREVRTGSLLRLPAFRETSDHFTRRLENLNEPLKIAFACGKARSAWVPVEILYQPQILSGKVRILPPAYTGLKPQEAVLDSTEISVLEGATVTLELTSNRPLGGGQIVFSPVPVPGQTITAERIQARMPSSHVAEFSWLVNRPGKISATLVDVRGTGSAKPMNFSIRAVPDRPPEVDLVDPPALLLATPKTVVPLVGEAKDEFSLANVRLVRTLTGFRDRSLLVAENVGTKNYAFHDKLDLAKVGAKAGQTIEVMLEASDYNPSLMGQGSSGVARIQVISEAQYAAYIRARAQMAEFLPRFEALFSAVQEARDKLDALTEAAETGDAEAIKKARDEAVAAHEKAAELLDKLATDFPAYDLEKRLQSLARAQAEMLRENLGELAKVDPNDAAGAKNAAKEGLERLGKNKKESEELGEDAALVAEAGKILEMAARFQKIYLDQKSVTDRLYTIAKEVSQGVGQNRRMLPSLGDTQEKNREALDDFIKELEKRIRNIPEGMEELGELRDGAIDFLLALHSSDPGSVMNDAARQARDSDASSAFGKAELARTLLERLMETPGNCFGEACQGNSPQFKVQRPDINDTLAQLLAGMCDGNGDGSGPPKQGTGG